MNLIAVAFADDDNPDDLLSPRQRQRAGEQARVRRGLQENAAMRQRWKKIGRKATPGASGSLPNDPRP